MLKRKGAGDVFRERCVRSLLEPLDPRLSKGCVEGNIVACICLSDIFAVFLVEFGNIGWQW
jgi:hypothetical protein